MARWPARRARASAKSISRRPRPLRCACGATATLSSSIVSASAISTRYGIERAVALQDVDATVADQRRVVVEHRPGLAAKQRDEGRVGGFDDRLDGSEVGSRGRADVAHAWQAPEQLAGNLPPERSHAPQRRARHSRPWKPCHRRPETALSPSCCHGGDRDNCHQATGLSDAVEGDDGGCWTRCVLFLMLCCLAPSGGASAEEALHGVALVIGQSAYRNLPGLPNPVNDAREIDALLSDLGFDVDAVLDGDRRRLERALQRFCRGRGRCRCRAGLLFRPWRRGRRREFPGAGRCGKAGARRHGRRSGAGRRAAFRAAARRADRHRAARRLPRSIPIRRARWWRELTASQARWRRPASERRAEQHPCATTGPRRSAP